RVAKLPELSVSLLEPTLTKNPEPGTDFELGLALKDLKRWPDAAKHLSAVAPKSDDYGRAQLELARCLLRMEQPKQARAAFEKSIEASPAEAAGHFELGRLLLQSKDKELMETATESLRVATYLEPEWFEAQLWFGQGCAKIGRNEEAATA